jgi:protein LTV1
VHRPQSAPNAHKVKKLDDLASELGSDAEHIRSNEGEAAQYGVYYDDTEYDYMQHLRDLDSSGGGGEVVFVEAKATQNADKSKGKGKAKQSLEDALRELEVSSEDGQGKNKAATDAELLDAEILPSKNLRHLTYQAQQNVPDALAGFQPDMDPRLREVLEALEDDAYVDDEDDIFQQLAKDGNEIDQYEFEDQLYDGDDTAEGNGWETDDTAKPAREYRTDPSEAPALVPTLNTTAEGKATPNESWMDDFKAFKKDQKTAQRPSKPVPSAAKAPSVSDAQSSLFTTTTNGGQRRKKRKGALTDASAYSMTSSSLVRTEQLDLLDARFEQLEAREYAPGWDDGDGMDDDDDDDDGGASLASGLSVASSVRGATRNDFDGILDDFLGGYSMHGRRQIKKGGWKSGPAQLDEIRRELGPARVQRGYSRDAAGIKGAPASGKAAALAFGAPAGSK